MPQQQGTVQTYQITDTAREFYDSDGGPQSNTLGYYLAKPGAMRMEKIFESDVTRTLRGSIWDNAVPRNLLQEVIGTSDPAPGGKMWKFQWTNINPSPQPACECRIYIQSFEATGGLVDSIPYRLHIHTTKVPLPCPDANGEYMIPLATEAADKTDKAEKTVCPIQIQFPREGTTIHTRPLLLVHANAPAHCHPLGASLRPHYFCKGQYHLDGPLCMGFPLSDDPLGTVFAFRLPKKKYEWYADIMVFSEKLSGADNVRVKVIPAT